MNGIKREEIFSDGKEIEGELNCRVVPAMRDILSAFQNPMEPTCENMAYPLCRILCLLEDKGLCYYMSCFQKDELVKLFNKICEYTGQTLKISYAGFGQSCLTAEDEEFCMYAGENLLSTPAGYMIEYFQKLNKSLI